ncbi:MAG: formylmethanofuran dehydrogenase subunit C [Candidatus Bathyarchaeota archaeon]|nr:formylmethanofuran dehydrogenase subunit C [Candidatus Bathyarchaeota archaeon]
MLTPRKQFKVPVYAECISPDRFSGRAIEEVSSFTVWEGNKLRHLEDLFQIRCDKEYPEPCIIQIYGDLDKVRMVGAKMTNGQIFIEGNIGMRLGEMMVGGEIIVMGDADSWVGCMMMGGRIEIFGSADDHVGSTLRGEVNGMRGGTIVVHGNAGNEVGRNMMGGFIRIMGNVGEFAGANMKDGSILVGGDCGGRAGANMLNGRIIVCGYMPTVLPTFIIDSIRENVKIDGEVIQGPFYRFIGDIAEGGEGKLFVAKEKNPQLRSYEKYL